MRGWFLLLAVAGLAGCADQTVPTAPGYVTTDYTTQTPLGFQPGSPRLTLESAAALQALRPGLPASAVIVLATQPGLIVDRTQQVSNALDRAVAGQPASDTGADGAALLVTTRRLMAGSCLQAGQPNARNIWPGDDSDRPASLPPGCATDNAIQEMVVRQADLVSGRPLAPGAALPVARAIERYYTTPDGSASLGLRGSAVDPGPAQSGTVAPAGQTGATGAADQGAGLLQGPLPQMAPSAPAAPTTSPTR